MGLTGDRIFVGFGFGPIQSGLFLREAFHSGNFSRLVIAEILPEVVQLIRNADGYFYINIAHKDHIENEEIGPIEIYNPAQGGHELEGLIEAVGAASEISTAVPSTANYKSEKIGSLHKVLAEGIKKKKEIGGPPAVIYAAENHNRAAEILTGHVFGSLADDPQDWALSSIQFLNTVIGKMSQAVTDLDEIKQRKLKTITRDSPRAFLVEAFNRIFISQIHLNDTFTRGVEVFQEKEDLYPFEEAKLYGHNAAHALLGYIGKILGLQQVFESLNVPGLVPFVRSAFLDESGKALIRKYKGIDPLFTDAGFRNYAEDLLERMTNPNLADSIDRVTRDTGRKLGWNDRLIGTMRLALEQDVQPIRYAFGAAAAIEELGNDDLSGSEQIRIILQKIWKSAPEKQAEADAVIQMAAAAYIQLKRWRSSGFPNLEEFFSNR